MVKEGERVGKVDRESGKRRGEGRCGRREEEKERRNETRKEAQQHSVM